MALEQGVDIGAGLFVAGAAEIGGSDDVTQLRIIGWAVQAEPVLTALGFRDLKLRSDIQLSIVAFNSNLRRYTKGRRFRPRQLLKSRGETARC